MWIKRPGGKSGGKKRGKNEGIRDFSFRTDSIRIHRKAFFWGGGYLHPKTKITTVAIECATNLLHRCLACWFVKVHLRNIFRDKLLSFIRNIAESQITWIKVNANKAKRSSNRLQDIKYQTSVSFTQSLSSVIKTLIKTLRTSFKSLLQSDIPVSQTILSSGTSLSLSLSSRSSNASSGTCPPSKRHRLHTEDMTSVW